MILPKLCFTMSAVNKWAYISKNPLTNLITHEFWNVYQIWVKKNLCLLIPPIFYTYPPSANGLYMVGLKKQSLVFKIFWNQCIVFKIFWIQKKTLITVFFNSLKYIKNYKCFLISRAPSTSYIQEIRWIRLYLLELKLLDKLIFTYKRAGFFVIQIVIIPVILTFL